MIIHRGYENLDLVNPVVTMGVFDGVHRGHKSLLDSLVSKAKEVNGDSVVITFSPHPRLVLEQDHPILSFLTTLEEKRILLEGSGIDHLIIVAFSKRFSRMSACDFVKEVLVGKVGTKHLLLGYDHHFGREGEGNFNTIKRCSSSVDFDVEQVQKLHTEEGEISSSSIREALLNGKLDDANRWLGYYYSLGGTVVVGRQIGRSIGFPTANIKPEDQYKLIPCNGVYAVEVRLDDVTYPGMLSIGYNPTVNREGNTRSIEVHILNFERDVYGKRISVIFRKRLRDEIKFDNTRQLADQMEIDKQITMQLLS